MFQPRGESIMEILMRQGDVAGRAALMRGEAISRGIEGVGNAVAQGVMAYGQQKDQKKREAQLDAAMASFDPANPMDFYRRTAVAVGPEAAMRVTSGMASLMKLQQSQQPDMKDAATLVGGLAALEEKAPGWIAKNWDTTGPSLEPVAKLFGVPLNPETIGETVLSLNAGLNKKAPTEPKTRQVEVTLPDGTKEIRIVEDKPGQTFASAAPPAKAPATLNVGGRVMQFNEKTGQFDIDLGKTEAAIGRETSAIDRETAKAEKEAAKNREAQEAKKAADSQVAAAFAAMETALGEVKKYAGPKALTVPLEAANARQQYLSAANAFAATLSRATGDTRISDLDRRAYAGLLTYTGPGKSLLMIARPDLIESRLKEAKEFFAAAAMARDGKTPEKPDPLGLRGGK
jgi:hypothetical protein